MGVFTRRAKVVDADTAEGFLGFDVALALHTSEIW
jgi:hypothetical protein